MEEIELLETVEQEPHKECLEDLSACLKQSTKENSIVIKFVVESKYCHCNAIEYDVDGSNKKVEDKTFSEIDKVISMIIEPLIQQFIKTNKIMINNILPNQKNTSDLKIISEDNDMINIIGLDENEIIRLSEMVNHMSKKENETLPQQKIDEKGVGNVLAFIISILVIGVILFGMLLPRVTR